MLYQYPSLRNRRKEAKITLMMNLILLSVSAVLSVWYIYTSNAPY